MSARTWPGDCRCGHPYNDHTHYTTAERCSVRGCTCTNYRRRFRQWFLDKIGT